MKRLRIRIVGGSLAGLFAGILLQRDGHDVKIYERSSSGLAGRGAGLVGQHDLFRILRAIGCEHLARVGVVAKERIYFNRDGSVGEAFRTPQTQISWDFLYSTVASHMAAESYLIGQPAIGVVEGSEGAQLLFADGRREDADLVIAADGLGSVVRPLLNEDASNRFAEPQPSIQGIFDFEAAKIVSAHTALIGDAAFVVRPHTAMGVSKAAGDALALREALLASEDLFEALSRYQEERLPVGKSIADYGRRLGESALQRG